MAKWVIYERDKDRFEIERGRRRTTTHQSLDEAIAVVKQSFHPDEDTVFHEAPDGYRTNLTKRMSPRRGWRK